MEFKDKIALVAKILNRVQHIKWLFPEKYQTEYFDLKSNRLKLVLQLIYSPLDLEVLLNLDNHDFTSDVLSVMSADVLDEMRGYSNLKSCINTEARIYYGYHTPS